MCCYNSSGSSEQWNRFVHMKMSQLLPQCVSRSTIDFIIVCLRDNHCQLEFIVSFLHLRLDSWLRRTEFNVSYCKSHRQITLQRWQSAAATRPFSSSSDMNRRCDLPFLQADPAEVLMETEAGLSFPMLGRSGVSPPCSRRVKLKPLPCCSSINFRCLLLSVEPWCHCLLSCIS